MLNIESLISDSQLAFLNQQNETALELANQAIGLDGKNSDAYKCAGNALIPCNIWQSGRAMLALTFYGRRNIATT